MTEDTKEKETHHEHHHTAETHTTAPSPSKKSSKVWMYAVAVIVIVAICAVALLYVNSGKKTTSLQSTSTIPSPTITSPGGDRTNIAAAAPNNPQALVLLKKIENYSVTMPMFTANYNGVIASTVAEYLADSSGSPTTYLLPPTSTTGLLMSKYEKYYNNSRSFTSVTVNQSSIEAINNSGNSVINISTYYFGNGTYYTCYNMTSSGCIEGNPGLGYSGQDPLSALNNFTISGLTFANSTYKGMSCSALMGNIDLNQSANQSEVDTAGNFSTCILEPYNTALYLNITFVTRASRPYSSNGTTENLQEGLKVSINELNITNSSSATFVNFSDRNAT